MSVIIRFQCNNNNNIQVRESQKRNVYMLLEATKGLAKDVEIPE